MTYRLKWWTVVTSLLVVGCAYPEEEGYGGVCVGSQAVEGGFELVVDASSRDCASDHRGAEFHCEVEQVDATSIEVNTYFRDGRDPNDGCAPPLYAECRVAVPAGEYQLRFADHQATLVVPTDDMVCLPEDYIDE